MGETVSLLAGVNSAGRKYGRSIYNQDLDFRDQGNDLLAADESTRRRGPGLEKDLSLRDAIRETSSKPLLLLAFWVTESTLSLH